jgi:hypothetical protein
LRSLFALFFKNNKPSRLVYHTSTGANKRLSIRMPPRGCTPKRAKYYVKLCPHVGPGGGVCGLTEEFCICQCLLCGGFMNARKRCGEILSDGTMCPWGQDRSVEGSEAEPSPEPAKPRMRQVYYMDIMYLTPVAEKRKAPQYWSLEPPLLSQTPQAPASAAPTAKARRKLSDVCLPNLEPGAPSQPPPNYFRRTEIVTWHRTAHAIQILACKALADKTKPE